MGGQIYVCVHELLLTGQSALPCKVNRQKKRCHQDCLTVSHLMNELFHVAQIALKRASSGHG